MVGKVVLAGITFCDAEGAEREHRQAFGRVLRVGSEGVVIADGEDGREITLPPGLEDYVAAEPGTYRLKGREATVVDPDYIATWRVYPRAKN